MDTSMPPFWATGLITIIYLLIGWYLGVITEYLWNED